LFSNAREALGQHSVAHGESAHAKASYRCCPWCFPTNYPINSIN